MSQKHPHRYRERAAANRRKKARDLKIAKRERRDALSKRDGQG